MRISRCEYAKHANVANATAKPQTFAFSQKVRVIRMLRIFASVYIYAE